MDDQIYDSEQHSPTEFIHGKRYLGVTSRPLVDRVLLNTVQAKTFFNNSFTDIVHYLYVYSISKPSLPPRILQLIILADETYSVCDKTFWLRLVQRRWKNVLQQRKKFGRNYVAKTWMPRLLGQQHIRIPQLYGMLAQSVQVQELIHIGQQIVPNA